eukprot:Skav233799  [mRNA]  locus=scaffold780:530507:531503:- [translate_table: standard]
MSADMHPIFAQQLGELLHNWGTAEKLYKSEAIDSFGNKYLLGVFEDPKDAEKAFDDWNKEYEKALEALPGEETETQTVLQCFQMSNQIQAATLRLHKGPRSSAFHVIN